ncbi:MAG: energy transducer TonB [Rhodocyclaceae bacterium]
MNTALVVAAWPESMTRLARFAGNRPAPDAVARTLVVALVCLAHALLFLGLRRSAPEFVAPAVPSVLQVSWIALPVRAPTPAPVIKPAPRVQPRVPARVQPPRPMPRTRPVSAAAQAVPAQPLPSAETQAPEPAPAAASAPAPQAATADTLPVTPPRFEADYLSNPAPPYPAAARELGEEGRVLLRVKISPQGQPVEIRLQRGSGHERLDQAALKAVGGWRFVPARRGSEPIEAWVQVPITFTLRK